MKRTNKRPIKLNGGIAIPIKKDMYLLKGRKHEQGGIDLGNVEAEGNEVVKQSPKSLKVFSRIDMFGDKSPAELVLRGANEDKVFNAQQKFKQINHLNDDGTKKAKYGIDTINLPPVIIKPTYTTKLNDKEEKEFNNWYSKIAKYKGLNPNPDDKNQYYDYRGFWKYDKNKDAMLNNDSDAHFTDRYKKPGHPTFSDESIYSNKRHRGGHWKNDRNGNWLFNHSSYTKKYNKRTHDYLLNTGEGYILNNDTIIPKTNRYKMGGLKRNEDYGSKKKPYPSVNKKDFAGGNRSYPIPTKADAVDALRLAGLHGRSDVRAKVYAKYPELRKARVGGLYSLTTNEGTRLRPFSTGKLPQAKLGTKKDGGFLNFLKNAIIGGAVAENPAVMAASGWNVDSNGNYKQKRTKASDELAENIAEIGAAAIGNGASATQGTKSTIKAIKTIKRAKNLKNLRTTRSIRHFTYAANPNYVRPNMKPFKYSEYYIGNNKVGRHMHRLTRNGKTSINKGWDDRFWGKGEKPWRSRELKAELPKKSIKEKIKKVLSNKDTYGRPKNKLYTTGKIAVPTAIVSPFIIDAAYKNINNSNNIPINNPNLPELTVTGKRKNKPTNSKPINKVNNVKDTVTVNNQVNDSIKSAPEINTSTISEPNIDNNVNIKSTTNVPNETKPKTKEVRRKNTIKTNKVINRNNIRKNVLKQNKEFVKELGKKLATEDLNLDIAKKNTKPVSVINTPSLNYDELSKRIRTIGKPKAYLGTYSRSRNKGQFIEGVEDYNDNSTNRRGNYNIKTKNVRYDLSNKGQIHDTDIGYNTRRNPNASVDNIKYNKSGSIIPTNKENNFNTGDAISLAGNIGGGIINYLNNKSALKDMSYRPAPVPRYATKLKTNININPQLDKMRETSARYEKLVRDNTISSRAGIGRIQSDRLRTLGDYNKLRSDVENLETDLINKDRLNQQDIANKNIDDYNNWRRDKNTFDNTIIENKAENKSNLIGTINAGIQNTISNVEQRHKDNQTILAYMASHPNVNPRLLKAMGIDGITQEMIDNWDKANGYKK